MLFNILNINMLWEVRIEISLLKISATLGDHAFVVVSLARLALCCRKHSEQIIVVVVECGVICTWHEMANPP